MRPLYHRIYWFAICLLPVLAKCQAQFSGEQHEVNSSMMAIAKAVSENNLDTLEKYIAANYKHTDPGGHLVDRKTWLSYFADGKEKNIKNPAGEFQDTQIQILGDVAIATGIIIFTGNADTSGHSDSVKVVKIRYTQVLKKENGIWRRFIFQGTQIEQ